MLDIFAFIFPLVVLVLWFAGENRKQPPPTISSDIDDKLGSQLLINFKYCTAPLPDPQPPQRLTLRNIPTTLATWLSSQDYIILFLAPLNVVTCTFFVVLYALRAISGEAPSIAGHVLSFSLYAALVGASLVALRVCKRNEESSLIVAVLTTIRALEALAPLLLAEGYELLISQTALDTWGNFLTVHLLTVLTREYFNEDKYSTWQPEDVEEGEDESTKQSQPHVTSIITKENFFIASVLACSLVTTVLVVIPEWHAKMWVIIGFECSISISLLMSLAVTILVLYQIIPLTRCGSASSVRTRWVVLAVITGGMLLRILFDVGANMNELSAQSYVPFVTMRAFLSFWKETFTLIIPLGFHLSLIINKATSNKDMMMIRDTTMTTKHMFCAYLLSLHLIAVGLLLETTTLSFTRTATCASLLLLTTNLSLALCKFVPMLAKRCIALKDG